VIKDIKAEDRASNKLRVRQNSGGGTAHRERFCACWDEKGQLAGAMT